MAETSLITVLCSCILLLSLVLSSIAASIPANIPDSDLPFEFNHNKGSEVVGENVLTQSVSSDGKTVLNIDNPQPIIKYKYNSEKPVQSTNPAYYEEIKINKLNSPKRPKNDRMKTNLNKPVNYSSYISSLQDMNQWNFLENISRYLPGMIASMRVIYI